MTVDLERVVQVARTAAEAAAEVSLKYFRQGVTVETKADNSPVTQADREAEAKILSVIQEAFPDHGILGEETGEQNRPSPYRWIVDPIDGTRGFTRGGRFWGSLIAFESEGRIVAGSMGLPAMGDIYWAAQGQGCFKNGETLRVSAIDQWANATVSLGEMRPLFAEPHGPVVIDLVKSAASARGYGDLMGCAMVLTGLADVWLEAGVKPWDLGPTQILIEEAGGRFTNFIGEANITHGTAIGSNGVLHDYVLEKLTPP